MPGSHATQEALGEPAVNPNPGSHMQCALPDEDHEVPGHGMQDEFDEEPEALLYVPAGHMLHTVLPDTSEYVPAPQSEHQEDEVGGGSGQMRPHGWSQPDTVSVGPLHRPSRHLVSQTPPLQ